MANAPNIVLLTIDCLRPDYLGCYNAEMEVVSPTIDSLAAGGWRFTNAFSAGPTTPMAMPPLLTGTYALSRGGPFYLGDERPYLPELLGDEYRTVGYQTNHWLNHNGNYHRGFDTYSEFYNFARVVRQKSQQTMRRLAAEGKTPAEIAAETEAGTLERYARLIEQLEEYLDSVEWQSEEIATEYERVCSEYEQMRTDFETFVVEEWEIGTGQGVEGLGERAASRLKGFAAAIPGLPSLYRTSRSVLDLNEPKAKSYASAERMTDSLIEEVETHDDERPLFLWGHFMDVHKPLRPGPDGSWHEEYNEYVRKVGEEPIPFKSIHPYVTDDIGIVRALYKACIRFVDEQLARLLESLRAMPGETVVILTADHGEALGERGWQGHQQDLYDELIHVPMIVSKLGDEDARTIDRLFSHVDFIPSIVEQFVDFEIEADLEGQDIFAERRDWIIAEALRSAQTSENGMALEMDDGLGVLVARSTEKKLLYEAEVDGQRWSWFDLDADPGERSPREVDGSVATLRAVLEDRLEDIATWEDRESSASTRDVDGIVADRLKDIGYLE